MTKINDIIETLKAKLIRQTIKKRAMKSFELILDKAEHVLPDIIKVFEDTNVPQENLDKMNKYLESELTPVGNKLIEVFKTIQDSKTARMYAESIEKHGLTEFFERHSDELGTQLSEIWGKRPAAQKPEEPGAEEAQA